MVLIREFRFVLPMSLEEYEIAGMYTILKMEQQNTTSKDGVEILQSIPFEDEHLGKGQHTSKVYHLESKIPPWLRTFASAALTLQEESWSAFPKSKSVVKCSRLKQCSMTIETFNKADNGCSENVHGLSKELLSQRKVEIIDIAAVSCDYWSKIIGTTKLDFSRFISQKTRRGPLSKGWQETCNPVMTSYKLVTMDAPIWGIGGHLEEAMIASQKALLSEFHKLCFSWIDEWFGMTMVQIMEMEKQNNLLLKKTFQKSFSTSKQDVKRKSKHETQKIVDVSSIVPV
ncbi:uncharacterized protein LOC141821952 [Curcuma longa]|uniref:uncharacterized protein LOC141821952 n=1 Tax=Curcuma longa TaxID=136217 RepID=UPI003D9EFF85